jgi:hypothetical protein
MSVRPRPDGSLELAGGNHSYYFAFTADHYMDTLEAENKSLKATVAELRKVGEEFMMRMHKAEIERGKLLEAIRDAWGALNFIIAFYDPDANRYLDTEAWKNAESGGRRVRAQLADLLSRERKEEQQ